MMWKLQKAFTTATKKERSRESLPQPPKGMAWWQNRETREWKLVPEDDDLLLQNEKKKTTVVDDTPNDESPLTASTHTLPSSNQHGQKKKKEDPTPTPTATATAREVETVEFEADSSTVESKDVFANPFDLPTPSNTQHVLLNLPEDHVINNAKDTNDNIHTMLHRFNVSGEESKSQHEVGSDDWELLSDKLSGSTSHGNSKSSGIAFVSRNGSISSHNTSTSLFSYGKLPSCHYKLERCPSNSTIDSHDADAVLGPSGKGVLGVDYVEHVILPSDTIQGICLAYKLSASRLKRANHFSGDSLAQAPKKLVIPISKAALQQGYLRVQDTDTKEYMLHALQAEFPQISATEAKAYLELANWKLQDAIRSAKEDHEWDNTPNTGNQSNLRSGQIRVMMGIRANNDHEGVQLDFSAQGAGYSAASPSRNNNKSNNKPVSTEAVNSTSVKLEDIPQVASQHNSVGVELQSLSLRK